MAKNSGENSGKGSSGLKRAGMVINGKAGRKVAREAIKLTKGPVTLKKVLALVFALVTALAAWNLSPGRVLKVADGDTITFVTQEREVKKVRLYGVDAPESQQAWGGQAKDFVSDLVFLKEVEIDVMDTDRYGRLVAVVYLPDGRILNEEVIRNGHGWVYRDFCKESYCRDWIAVEQQAKNERIGLWAQKNPTAPWKWRRENNK